MFTFVETALFTRLVEQYLSDDEYLKLQLALAENPERGPLIPGSGGFRIIYYLRLRSGVIWMLTMYPKNVSDSIPAHVLRQIRKEIEDA